MPLQKRHEAAIEFEFVMVFPPITGSPLRNPKKPRVPPSQGLLLCAPFGGPAVADVVPHKSMGEEVSDFAQDVGRDDCKFANVAACLTRNSWLNWIARTLLMEIRSS